jgi:hypothetical protein
VALYDFSALSPADFELLVRDLLCADLGWSLEAFGQGPDGGVDLRGSHPTGHLIVQCKHYAGSRFADLHKAMKSERTKIETEKPNLYVLVTSQKLTRTQKDTIVRSLKPWLVDSANIITRLELNEMIDRHPEVEQRHFKLWLASTHVLERIVRSGMWERSEALMEDIHDRVRLYVPNQAYERADAKLRDVGVAVLTGQPGTGKSMLADMLVLWHWQNGWQVITVSSDIDEAWNGYRRDRKQIFVYDDFLGQTDLSESRSKNEGARLVRFMERVANRSDKRLVMTTRSQVLRQAELRDEPIARGRFSVYECNVRVGEHGPVNRARILYNHLYFSALPRSVVSDYVLRDSYWAVVRHPNFMPRIVEQVIKQAPSNAAELDRRLRSALDRPTELWAPSFTTSLSAVAQRIVLSLIAFPIDGATPQELRDYALRDSGPIQYTHALKALEGTWITITAADEDGHGKIRLADASCRDFAHAFLDCESDFAVDLVLAAPDVDRALAILDLTEYGIGETPQYPNLVANLKLECVAIGNRIRGLIAHLGGSLIDSGRDLLRPTAVIAHALDHSWLLGRDTEDWLLRQALELGRRANECWVYDAPSIPTIVIALMEATESGRLVAADIADPLVALLRLWAEALVDQDSVLILNDFCDKHRATLAPFVDARALFEEAAEAYLESELEYLPDGADDRIHAQFLIGETEDVAQRTGLLQMQAALDRKRREIEEHFREDEYSNVRSRSVEQPTTALDVVQESDSDLARQERERIRSLFEQLG